MVKLFYTIDIILDLAHYKTFIAKLGNDGIMLIVDLHG